MSFLKSMKVHEVSPVMLGAGIDTRLLAMKGLAEMTPDEQFEAIEKSISEASAVIKEGRVLSSRNMTRITNMVESMRGMMDEMERMMAEAQPEDSGKAVSLFAGYQLTLAKINGHLS